MRPELSPEEEARAAGTFVHVLWELYREETTTGGKVTRGVPLAMYHSAEAAAADVARRTPEQELHLERDCNLLAFERAGFADAGMIRRFLDGNDTVPLPPTEWDAPGVYAQQLHSMPLRADEIALATNIAIWTVYYEDWFEVGAGRDSFPVALCLSQEEAMREVQRRGAVASGRDGYLARGPHPLARGDERVPVVEPNAVREVLRRVAAGLPGPVPVSS